MADRVFIDGDWVPYDASDPKHVKEKRKAARQEEQARAEMMNAIMSIPQGRKWIWELLSWCNIGHSVLNSNPYLMAHSSGQQDVGFRIMADAMMNQDSYLQMIKEAKEREDAKDA